MVVFGKDDTTFPTMTPPTNALCIGIDWLNAAGDCMCEPSCATMNPSETGRASSAGAAMVTAPRWTDLPMRGYQPPAGSVVTKPFFALPTVICGGGSTGRSIEGTR